MMNRSEFNKFLANTKIKLTDLRKDVLAILFKKHKPLGAYEILELLRKNRPNAEPPTVYRVLEFLVAAKLVHRIESQNAYVCCSHVDEQHVIHKTILLICKICQHSFEYANAAVMSAIHQFAEKNAVNIDSELLEIKGTCTQCLEG